MAAPCCGTIKDTICPQTGVPSHPRLHKRQCVKKPIGHLQLFQDKPSTKLVLVLFLAIIEWEGKKEEARRLRNTLVFDMSRIWLPLYCHLE